MQCNTNYMSDEKNFKYINLNVLKDLNDDLQSGIKGFPQIIGERYSKIIAAISFSIGLIFVLLFFRSSS